MKPDDERWKDSSKNEYANWMAATPISNMIDRLDAPHAEPFGDEDDDELEEALGIPYSPAKGSHGTGGIHTGGRVMPGTSGEWGGRPKGGKWDNRVDDDELEKRGKKPHPAYGKMYGEQGSTVAGHGLPMGNPFRTRRQPPNDVAAHDQTDDEVEAMISHEVPPVDMPGAILKVGNPSFSAIGHARKYSRHQPGFTWKEGRHRGLVEAFVSLKDVPAGNVQASMGVREADDEAARGEFGRVSTAVHKAINDLDDAEIVKLLFKIDPERFAKSLGAVGKEKLVDIYEKWAESVVRNDAKSINSMAERLASRIGLQEIDHEDQPQ